jgi:5-methylcytosine-specific restriction endonuclease McrBC GTP-binding regulatory subunit McrB
MKIYFAKISNKLELGNQFDNGFYLSQKGSPAYGDLNGVNINLGPIYVFVITKGKGIGLWKAINWAPDESKLHFEIILSETALSIKSLSAFKYFQLNTNLIVFTSRQSKNKHFFEIKFQSNFTEDQLRNPNTYTNADNFRKIQVSNIAIQVNTIYDLQLTKTSTGLTFQQPINSDNIVFQSFRDNTSFSNGSRPRKDKVLLKINQVDSFPKIFPYDSISIRDIYDAFFCDYNEKLEEEVDDDSDEAYGNVKNNLTMNEESLNQILFGPPGTGKTYNTINLAVELAYPNKFYEYKESDNDTTEERVDKRKKLTDFFRKNLYDSKNNLHGRIAFTTFHQSMAYEDFIEGIKPIDPKESGKEFLVYEVKDGIFKDFCKSAKAGKSDKTEKLSKDEFNSARFVKLNFTTENEKLAKDCIKYNYITFYNDIPFDLREENQIAQHPKYKLEKGDIKNLISPYTPSKPLIVIITLNESECLGVGLVKGEYNFLKDKENKHIREKVEWIKSISFPTAHLLKPSETSKGKILFFNSKEIEENFFFPESKIDISESNQKTNYVFIIDEINRGNIAQIFGELITLIEDTKREGQDEGMKAILPYSKESFSVPCNLYIIGTMNTADRSVEALDSALRRRFSFIEMMPDATVIKPALIPNTDINLQQLLTKINERLEVLLSKEHTIGHTYLLGIENINDLKCAFNNKIIPLLKEYFYGDFGKISMVLGNYFVYQEKNAKPQFLGDYKDMIEEYDEALPWKFKTLKFDKSEDMEFIEAVKIIYTTQNKN